MSEAPSKELKDLRSRARILVVDDDKNLRLLTRLMLSQCGYAHVDDTDDPVNAGRKIERGMIDLVLLDWWMPELNGLELLQTVRSYNPDFPIIMMTSEKKKENIINAIQSGATDYIVKPVKRDDLVQKIDKVLLEIGSRLRYRR